MGWLVVINTELDNMISHPHMSRHDRDTFVSENTWNKYCRNPSLKHLTSWLFLIRFSQCSQRTPDLNHDLQSWSLEKDNLCLQSPVPDKDYLQGQHVSIRQQQSKKRWLKCETSKDTIIRRQNPTNSSRLRLCWHCDGLASRVSKQGDPKLRSKTKANVHSFDSTCACNASMIGHWSKEWSSRKSWNSFPPASCAATARNTIHVHTLAITFYDSSWKFSILFLDVFCWSFSHETMSAIWSCGFG